MITGIVILLFWFYLCYSFSAKILPNANTVLVSCIAFIASNTLLAFLYILFLFSHIPFIAFQISAFTIPLIYLISIKPNFPLLLKSYKRLNTPNWVLALFLLLLYNFTSSFLTQSTVWGQWDAWAVWSLHAKFLLQESSFTQLFSGNLEWWSHPDYPLLLPSIIAFYWKSIGSINSMIPLLVAYFTCTVLLLLAYSSLVEKGGLVIAIIYVYIVSCNEILLPFGASQYADTLLALFILISFVLYNHIDTNNKIGISFLIGFFVASSAWIKNEGVVFFILFSLGYAIRYIKQTKTISWYILGTIIPLCFILFFKIHFAPVNDLIKDQNHPLMSKLSDINRYNQVWDFISNYMSVHAKTLLYALLFIFLFQLKFYRSLGFIILFGLFISYFMIYVMSPKDIEWHLNTSFDRLLHQISPALMYLIAIQLRNFFSATTLNPHQTLKDQSHTL